jgi:hypothetical protein
MDRRHVEVAYEARIIKAKITEYSTETLLPLSWNRAKRLGFIFPLLQSGSPLKVNAFRDEGKITKAQNEEFSSYVACSPLAEYNAGELAFMDHKAARAASFIHAHPGWYAWMSARRTL